MKCERPFFNAKKHGLNRLQFTMCGRMIHTISPRHYLSKKYHTPPPVSRGILNFYNVLFVHLSDLDQNETDGKHIVISHFKQFHLSKLFMPI
jgi:hypothetical protein